MPPFGSIRGVHTGFDMPNTPPAKVEIQYRNPNTSHSSSSSRNEGLESSERRPSTMLDAGQPSSSRLGKRSVDELEGSSKKPRGDSYDEVDDLRPASTAADLFTIRRAQALVAQSSSPQAPTNSSEMLRLLLTSQGRTDLGLRSSNGGPYAAPSTAAGSAAAAGVRGTTYDSYLSHIAAQQYAQHQRQQAATNTLQMLSALNRPSFPESSFVPGSGLSLEPAHLPNLLSLQALSDARLTTPASSFLHTSSLAPVPQPAHYTGVHHFSALLEGAAHHVSGGSALHQAPSSAFFGSFLGGGSENQQHSIESLLRRQLQAGYSHPGTTYGTGTTLSRQLSASLNSNNRSPTAVEYNTRCFQAQRIMALPPCEEGPLSTAADRPCYPLGTDEDPNWLSEFHCFVRTELIEVFRASREDCKARNNSITYQQVGIRCRFCAHLAPSARAGRSSAFPSSLNQIYQSFTMMLRDHFGACDAIPTTEREKFLALKDKPSQGATDSKRFWVYSAMKIGMTDSLSGIMISENTRAAGASTASFGATPGQQWEDPTNSSPLVLPSDRALVSEFLYLLMSQTQVVYLTEAERIGNRRSLRLGLPGFGCRFCYEHHRLGLCRMFPARRRTLPGKVMDLYDHIRRCTVCPDSVKEQIDRTQHHINRSFQADQGSDREFFDRIWVRLGHGNQSAADA